MVDNIRFVFNIIFFLVFIFFVYSLGISNFTNIRDFLSLYHTNMALYIILVIIFNIFYSLFLYSRLYFLFNGTDDTYTFLKLKIMRNSLKSSFDISVLLKLIMLKKDQKSLDDVYFYLKDRNLKNKVIIELYSVLIGFREKEKATSLILKYKNKKYKWIKYLEALSMITLKEKKRLLEVNEYLKKYSFQDPIFTIYYYYLLKNSSLEKEEVEKVKLQIREKYNKNKKKINKKNTKLLKHNLFFVVFYYIYYESTKDIFY